MGARWLGAVAVVGLAFVAFAVREKPEPRAPRRAAAAPVEPAGEAVPVEAVVPSATEPLRQRIRGAKTGTADVERAERAPMLAMAADDPDARCRAFALRALSLRPDPALEAFFVERLSLDPDALPRYVAAKGLERLRAVSAETVEKLETALRVEESDKVRRGIRDTLTRHRR